MNDTTMTLHCEVTKNIGSSLLPVVMITGMIIGLPLNIVALWIFCFRMKPWKPHTLFLFNLVLADFLLLISMPFSIDAQLRQAHWVFGETWCSINLFMLAVNRSASTAFMTTVAINRFFKVVHPHHFISHMTLTQAGWLVGLIWTIVIALRIPLLTINLLSDYGNVSLCRSFNSYENVPLQLMVHYVAYVAEFFLPWFVLLFCSARIICALLKRNIKKKMKAWKATIAVGVITLVFTLCFMPGVVTGLAAIYIKKFHPKDCESYKVMIKSFMRCIAFTYINSTLDPLIYTFSSSMFRDALKTSFSCLGFAKTNIQPAHSIDNIN